MSKLLLLSVIGLLGLGALPGRAADGEPGAGHILAQARKSDVTRQLEPGLSNNSRLENDTPVDSSQALSAAQRSSLTAVRFLTTHTYTRVMMELSQEVRYEIHRLKEDPSKGLPPRIYIDLFNAKLAMEAKEPISVEDGLLRQVRIRQFSSDVVRVVLDMTSFREHNAFFLPDPYRLLIDIQGQGQKTHDVSPTVDSSQKRTVSAPVQGKPATHAGIRKIVLDPGHGGKDPGAIGVGGIAEKDIVLAVALKLAQKLKRDMGVEVVLTRKDDRFIALEDRTAIANAEDADLFLSLHMNASPNAEAKGLETYYLDNTSDEASMRLAARENATSRKNISDLQFILSDMMQNMKLEDSITLAHRLQHSLVGGMSKRLVDVRDLGVKKALFHVLVGARMPSVLVEMFFITNRSEGRAMSQDRYQNAVVDALYDGIVKYKETTLASKTL
jgi:N-acetylmuramoyl-L-alanine amidase